MHFQELELTLIEKGIIDGDYLQKMKADVIETLQPEPEQIADMSVFLAEQQDMLMEKLNQECSRWDRRDGGAAPLPSCLKRGNRVRPSPSTPVVSAPISNDAKRFVCSGSTPAIPAHAPAFTGRNSCDCSGPTTSVPVPAFSGVKLCHCPRDGLTMLDSKANASRVDEQCQCSSFNDNSSSFNFNPGSIIQRVFFQR